MIHSLLFVNIVTDVTQKRNKTRPEREKERRRESKRESETDANFATELLRTLDPFDVFVCTFLGIARWGGVD